MKIFQHKSGASSVAFAPDGTLFVLTTAEDLWAYPPDGSERVYVGNTSYNSWTKQFLTVSPDGRWLSVSGGSYPILYEIGSLTPAPGRDRKRGLAWQKKTFDGEAFSGRTEFTGDSAFWIGEVKGVSLEVRQRLYYCLPLSGSPAFHFAPTWSVLPWSRVAPVPGTPTVVFTGWSDEPKAVCHWLVDLTVPERPAERIGTSEHGGRLTVPGDGRFFLLDAERGLGVYSRTPEGLRLDLAVRLPGFNNIPTLAVSGDGRRFVASDLMNKLVYAGDAATGELFGPWDWNIGTVNGVAIAPDGLTAAAAGSGKKVVVWDLE